MIAYLPDRQGNYDQTLSPVVIEVPYGVITERRPEQRVQLGQDSDQPAKQYSNKYITYSTTKHSL